MRRLVAQMTPGCVERADAEALLGWWAADELVRAAKRAYDRGDMVVAEPLLLAALDEPSLGAEATASVQARLDKWRSVARLSGRARGLLERGDATGARAAFEELAALETDRGNAFHAEARAELAR